MARPKKERVLSPAEKFYIESKGLSDSAEQISQDIGVPFELVLANMPSVPPARSTMLDMVATKTKAGKEAGIAIMTQGASELADATKHVRYCGKSVECIHKPRG